MSYSVTKAANSARRDRTPHAFQATSRKGLAIERDKRGHGGEDDNEQGLDILGSKNLWDQGVDPSAHAVGESHVRGRGRRRCRLRLGRRVLEHDAVLGWGLLFRLPWISDIWGRCGLRCSGRVLRGSGGRWSGPFLGRRSRFWLLGRGLCGRLRSSCSRIAGRPGRRRTSWGRRKCRCRSGDRYRRGGRP